MCSYATSIGASAAGLNDAAAAAAAAADDDDDDDDNDNDEEEEEKDEDDDDMSVCMVNALRSESLQGIPLKILYMCMLRFRYNLPLDVPPIKSNFFFFFRVHLKIYLKFTVTSFHNSQNDLQCFLVPNC